MSLGLSVLLVFVVSATSEVRAVRVTTVDQRTAMRLLTSEDVPGAMVVREGDEVVITLPAHAAAELQLPPLQPPLEALGVERREDRTILRVRVAKTVPFQATHETGMTTVLFGEPPAGEAAVPITPELYGKLFPTGSLEVEKPVEDAAALAARRGEGFALGPLRFQPWLSASWVQANVAFDTPQPVPEHYLQVAPGISVQLPIRDGQLAVDYEPRLRFFSNIPELGETSHTVTGRFHLPVGTRLVLSGNERFTHAVLEANVVDPGQEYFFNLAPYTATESTLVADLNLGPRLTANGGVSLRTARFEGDPGSGFFDYDARTLRAGLGYDLGAELKAQLNYSYDSVPPPPERPLAETYGHTVGMILSGPIGPVMTGTLGGGWSRRTSPQASGPSRNYDGLVLAASLRRDLSHATSLELRANRAANLSAFEQNAYYVSNSGELALNVPLPFQTTARGSVNVLWNDYPNDAAALGEPRRDQIVGWTLGIGRQFGARSYLRFDYRRQTRDSNLPGYDVTTDGFTVQLGISATGAQH